MQYTKMALCFHCWWLWTGTSFLCWRFGWSRCHELSDLFSTCSDIAILMIELDRMHLDLRFSFREQMLNFDGGVWHQFDSGLKPKRTHATWWSVEDPYFFPSFQLYYTNNIKLWRNKGGTLWKQSPLLTSTQLWHPLLLNVPLYPK